MSLSLSSGAGTVLIFSGVTARGLGEGMPWGLGIMGGARRVRDRGVCAALVWSQGVDSRGSEVAMGKQAVTRLLLGADGHVSHCGEWLATGKRAST